MSETREDIATRIHAMYVPNDTNCSFVSIDWDIAKEIKQLQAKIEELEKANDLLTLGLLQEKTRVCKWQYIDGAAYQTQCGKRLCKTHYEYCHNCGGKIKQALTNNTTDGKVSGTEPQKGDQ